MSSFLSRGFAPTLLTSLPPGFVNVRFRWLGQRNRGGIGCADCMPPPRLGARQSLRDGTFDGWSI
jgi:hypothetical protein